MFILGKDTWAINNAVLHSPMRASASNRSGYSDNESNGTISPGYGSLYASNDSQSDSNELEIIHEGTRHVQRVCIVCIT